MSRGITRRRPTRGNSGWFPSQMQRVLYNAAANAARQAASQAANYVAESISNLPQRGSSGIPGNIALPFQTPRFTGSNGQSSKPDASMRMSKYRSYTFSKSAGKLKMRKRRKLNFKQKTQKFGYVKTIESNTVASTENECIYIGHHTHPYEQMRTEIWAIILGLMFRKMNIIFHSRTDSVITRGLQIGDIISIKYRSTPLSTVLTGGHTVALDDTFADIISTFASSSQSWWNTRSEQVTLESLEYIPTTVQSPSRCEVNLHTTYIKIKSVSHLKLQNRTINSTGNDESDDVDNMPLYGKGYMVSGNQARISSHYGSVERVLANQVTGLVNVNSGVDMPEEPPQSTYFVGVKQIGKIHLDPGQLKTSSVTASLSGSVNSVHHKYNQSSSGNQRTYNGKMKFYAIEKMINTTVERPIIIGLELNTTFYSTGLIKDDLNMKPEFARI